MAPVGPVIHQNPANKIKRPVPAGIQTNGAITSAKNSPSPSMSAKKPPLSAKQPHSASERSITASTVRPVNRVRRETLSQVSGRNSRNSAGLRSASLAADPTTHDKEPPPYVVTDAYILRKHAGSPPSLIVHMHPTHFRFDNQDGTFQYKSPMKLFLDHVRSRTIPHDLISYFIEGGVTFYDGCLIVQVHDHKSVAQTAKDVARPASTTSTVVTSSIHNYNQCLTPSPYVPFPKESLSGGDTPVKPEEESKEKVEEEKDKENLLGATSNGQTDNTPKKPKVFTVVLHPTPESLQMDLLIKASTPRGACDGAAPSLIPPSTPISMVPPTPTAASMPPPAKRQKREKMELDGNNIHEAEGQILLATNAPLMLEPTKSAEETIVLLDALSHPKHSDAPPQPKTRKRTVAEMAADEAAAAEQERYMLVLDERLSNATGAQGGGAADGNAQSSAATFDPRFERFKVIEDIKREHAEKKEQEKIKQQENDRRLQQQRQQQQQQEALLQAQRQQAAEQERTRRETAARETAQRQAEAQRQARAAAASTPSNQNAAVKRQPPAQPQQHAHPAQNVPIANGMANGVTTSAPHPTPAPTTMQAQAQPRFQAQISQPPASSPVARQGTPQNMSSPMVGSVPMQPTNSGAAGSPPRPSSVVQNHPMSVPMAHNMSSRGSQQSHPSGTPRIPNSTPNIPHGTPINRQAMTATPRMTQASPPPAMMAQNSQMGQAQAMMMNNQAMNQANPQLIAQMAAQQRAIAHQQQLAALQNGVANGNINGQTMTPQQQQMMQIMQRQMLMQQQQAQQQQHQQHQQQQHQQQQHQQQGGMMNQQQLAQQYAQQLQNMQGGQMRQMTPQMQAQMQQMARMSQMNGQMGNPMQRQVSGQMMNGNMNLQALAAMQQQQQQQQQAQQQQQTQQPQQPQQQQQMTQVQVQIQTQARMLYQKMVQTLAAKHGALDRIPPELLEKVKQTSLAQAQQLVQQSIVQRRQQQQMMMQQHQQQQQQQLQQMQQQQMQQMQGMNGMMGHQGM